MCFVTVLLLESNLDDDYYNQASRGIRMHDRSYGVEMDEVFTVGCVIRVGYNLIATQTTLREATVYRRNFIRKVSITLLIFCLF